MHPPTHPPSARIHPPSQVGYVIPTTVVSHFMTDYVRHGKFTGFPALGVAWQRMESETLRRAYGMGPKQKGEAPACPSRLCACARLGRA
jgi:hypothetical protein